MKPTNSHQITLLFSLLMALLLMPLSCFSMTVSFNKEVHVTKKDILLRDLVEFDRHDEFTKALGSQYITTASEPGTTVTLQSRNIIHYLSSNLALPPDLVWTGSETITVQRDAIIIGPEKIDSLINDYLQKNKHRLPEAEISFKPRSYPLPFSLPKGELTCDIKPSNPRIIGSGAFTLIFKINGHVEENMMIRGDLKALTEVTVAKVPLRRGTILRYEQLGIEIKDISDSQAPAYSMEDVVGKRMLTNLRTDDIIELTDVEAPPVIKKGEMVRIVVHSGGLHLTASGIAKMDGKINEVIRVRNTSSNKLVHCRVSGPGQVEVNI